MSYVAPRATSEKIEIVDHQTWAVDPTDCR